MDYKSYLNFWKMAIFKKTKIVTDKYISVYYIDYNKLKKNKIQLLIFDYDETLTDFHGDLPEQTKELLEKLNKDFKIAILSNFPNKRLEALNKNLEGLNIYLEKESNKPATDGYNKILKKFKVSANNTAMIGEKAATDLFGAYLAKIKIRILVQPFSDVFSGNKAPLLLRFFRNIENSIAR